MGDQRLVRRPVAARRVWKARGPSDGDDGEALSNWAPFTPRAALLKRLTATAAPGGARVGAPRRAARRRRGPEPLVAGPAEERSGPSN